MKNNYFQIFNLKNFILKYLILYIIYQVSILARKNLRFGFLYNFLNKQYQFFLKFFSSCNYNKLVSKKNCLYLS